MMLFYLTHEIVSEMTYNMSHRTLNRTVLTVLMSTLVSWLLIMDYCVSRYCTPEMVPENQLKTLEDVLMSQHLRRPYNTVENFRRHLITTCL